MANRQLQIITLKGPVTVTYRQDDDGDWIATALEFDIVGTGNTQDAAFNQLRELISDYLLAYISSKGRAQFYNPADGYEWENTNRKHYMLVFILTAKVKRAPRVVNTPRDLRKFKGRLRELDLVAAGA